MEPDCSEHHTPFQPVRLLARWAWPSIKRFHSCVRPHSSIQTAILAAVDSFIMPCHTLLCLTAPCPTISY